MFGTILRKIIGVGKFTPPQPTYILDAPQDRVKEARKFKKHFELREWAFILVPGRATFGGHQTFYTGFGGHQHFYTGFGGHQNFYTSFGVTKFFIPVLEVAKILLPVLGVAIFFIPV